jgi:multidrug efflux pump subunit AcrA (membrane-fusion protein)
MSPTLSLLFVCLLVQAPQERTQGFQVSGKIKDVLVKPGDTVKVGQVLARLDDSLIVKEVELQRQDWKRLSAAVQVAEAEYQVAKAIFERDDDLFKKKVIPKVERDISEVRMKKARAEADKAKADLEHMKTALEKAELELQLHNLTSDFDGTVSAIHKHKYENIEAHKTFITMTLPPKK